MYKSRSTKKFITILIFIAIIFSSHAQETRTSIISPKVLPDNRVTFSLYAPDATEVKLVGGWMRNSPSGETMTKNDDGVWTYTTSPLNEDMYLYIFNVNGVTSLDPSNIKVARDGARYQNYFVINGEYSQYYDMKDVPHGTLSEVWYDSPVFDMQRRMYVYTPPYYEKGKDKYPVLYLFHGNGGDEDAWTSVGAAVNIMDNVIAEGKVKPMIVVMTNGNYNQKVSPDKATPVQVNFMTAYDENAGKFEESVIKDIIPYIDSNFRTYKNRDKRAIAGLSMGGGQATYAGFNNIDKFAWIGSFSGAFVVWPDVRPAPGVNDIDLDAVENIVFPNLNSSINSKMKLVYLAIGTEDPLIDPQRKFKDWLREKSIQFVDAESEGYSHVWSLWRIDLIKFTTQLFK